MKNIIKRFEEHSKWIVHPPCGQPKLSNDALAPHVKLPEEIQQFYELCGGLESIITVDEDLYLKVVAPDEFSWAVKKILSNTYKEEYYVIGNDLAWNWYIFGVADTDQFFVIDPTEERQGVCYFIQRYFFGQAGWTPIIAHSFQGLLLKFLQAVDVGETWSWKDPALGDAYQ